jgi:hypothetical protein
MPDDMKRWPKWMKYPTVNGYGIEVAERRIVSDMEIGSLFRVEFDTDESTASCELFLNAIESNWFEGFERSVLYQGSKWFILPLWVGGQLLDHTVRFRERPRLTEKNGEYSTYAFKLDVSKRNDLMDGELIELLTEHDPEELMKASDLLQIVTNERFPASMPSGRLYI